MKRSDVLLLIAIWEFFIAFWALVGICAIATIALPDALVPVYGPTVAGTIFGLSLAILVLLLTIGLSVTGGIGLLKGREWGRVLGIVHAALSLFYVPIGTIIGVLILIYLTKDEVRDYFPGSS